MVSCRFRPPKARILSPGFPAGVVSVITFFDKIVFTVFPGIIMYVTRCFIGFLVVYLGISLPVHGQEDEAGEKEKKKEEPVAVKTVDNDHIGSVIVEVSCRRAKGDHSRRTGTGGIIVRSDGYVLVTDVNRIYPGKKARESGVYIVDDEYKIRYKKKDYTGKFFAKLGEENLGLIKITSAPDDFEFNHVSFASRDSLSKEDKITVLKSHTEPPKQVDLLVRSIKDRKGKPDVYVTEPTLMKHMLLDIHLLGMKKGRIVGLVAAEPVEHPSTGLSTHRGKPRILLSSHFKKLIQNPEQHRVSGNGHPEEGTEKENGTEKKEGE